MTNIPVSAHSRVSTCNGNVISIVQTQDRVKLTSMSVSIHGIGGCYGQIVEQAETMTARGVIGTGYHSSWACMMPRGPDCTESIAHLQSYSVVWVHIPSWYFV